VSSEVLWACVRECLLTAAEPPDDWIRSYRFAIQGLAQMQSPWAPEREQQLLPTVQAKPGLLIL